MDSAETVLKMCGLEKYGDAIVGSLGVEHRKRTTIGVELAAKVCKVISRRTVSHGDAPQAQIASVFGRADFRPRLTECLGYRKFLARLGQPRSGDPVHVSCRICLFSQHGALTPRSPYSIHQPSAELFQEFDRLLLLRKGGQTVYFGDIAQNASTLINYFQSNGGKPCPPEANP